ncbi:MipA/OmpV family protein [Yunchengibacter salinarum]|uniref:MipA/OmpV family protein n=1 Tax=Yunchengibacter salinarum TaxID=3133399 RepID=UPI0035B57696
MTTASTHCRTVRAAWPGAVLGVFPGVFLGVFLGIWGLLAVPQAASAQEFEPLDRMADTFESITSGVDSLWPDALEVDGLQARVGFATGLVPDYTGSNNMRLRALPLIQLRYKDVWKLNDTKFSYFAWHNGPWSAGPLANLVFGRDERRNKVLEGLGDIKTTLELGGFVQYRTEKALVDLEMRQALGAGQGATIRLTAGQGIYKSGKLFIGLAGRLKWQSDKSMRTNFGVSPEQAARSTFGLETFTPKSTISEGSINLVGAYNVTERARFLALISYARLLGDASDSPLVAGKAGSANQMVLGTALTFTF